MLSASDLLSRNDFAKAVLERLRQLGAAILPRYDELSFAFFVDVSAAAATGTSGHLRLEQWYERYKMALLDGRGQRAIDDLAHHWVQLLKHAEAKYALDTARMIPLLRSRFDFAVSALRTEVYGHGETALAVEQLAWRPLNEHLVVALAEDSPHAWKHVTRTQLEHAGMTWEAALALAMKNLPRLEAAFRQQTPFVRSEGNTWVPASKQSPHNATWLLWPDHLRALPVAGQHVAFAPFTHTLAITGTQNHQELLRLAQTTLSLSKTIADKPLAAIPLVLEGNAFRPWLPPVTHPLHSAIRELWCLHENSLYAEQAKLLKRKAEGQDDAPYIAAYKIVASTSPSGERRLGTLTMWTESLTTSLPKADAVGLTKLLNRQELEADENAEPKLGERILVSWQDLAGHLGPRLKPEGMYPERYLVSRDDFPCGAAWDGLAPAQLKFPDDEAPQPTPLDRQPAAAPAMSPAPSPAAIPALAPLPATPGLQPLGAASPIAAPMPQPRLAPAPLAPVPTLPPSPPLWQPPQPASKLTPLAPARRPPMWPVLVVVALPIAAALLLLVAVSVAIYWYRSAVHEMAQDTRRANERNQYRQTNPAQAVRQASDAGNSTRQRAALLTPPAVIETPAPRPPSYIIKLPWTEIEPFPELGKPETALPRLDVPAKEAMPSGRSDMQERGHDEFRDDAPAGGWLVGFRLVRGRNWGGAIRSLQPIWQVEHEYVLGKLCGSAGGEAQTQVLAKPGYAVGKIESRAGLVNNAVRLTFYRVGELRLDPDDSYATPWLGSEGGGEMPPIGGRGEAIVGISGTYLEDEDVVGVQGLVALPLPKPEKALDKSRGTARNGPATPQRFGSKAGDEGPEGSWLVGLRVFQGKSWGGAPLAIQPIYQIEDRYVLGTRLGKDGGELHEWLAPPGYAVGEIWADQGLVVHRLQLRYHRVSGSELDDGDTKDSPRLGPDGGEQHCLASDGKPIVGLTVELGHDIGALGLIVAEK